MRLRDDIAKWLRQFPEVMWDRYTGNPDDFMVYGWIEREKDAYKDFVVLEFASGQPTFFVTSSVKYSEEFNRRLGFEADHQPCKRVEDFVNIKNMVKL